MTHDPTIQPAMALFGLLTHPEQCPSNLTHEPVVRPWPESQTPRCKWCGRALETRHG